MIKAPFAASLFHQLVSWSLYLEASGANPPWSTSSGHSVPLNINEINQSYENYCKNYNSTKCNFLKPQDLVFVPIVALQT